jgi:hypothetical protein
MQLGKMNNPNPTNSRGTSQVFRKGFQLVTKPLIAPVVLLVEIW